MYESEFPWTVLNSLISTFHASVRASAPIGDDDLGYFVNVQGMTVEQLAGLILADTNDTEELALLAAAAITALVLRDYQDDDEHQEAS